MVPKNSKKANKLIQESSPYLLQHAYNPVNWYPWGDEAFDKARNEDKPIFLSIGYSTCHWCHVMAHESFEDSKVAKLMNDTFVSIKVDREERPDIDNIYMTVCQMLTSRGGWPLTVIMTPLKKPFFAATYIPKKSRLGMIGMLELIPKVKKLWKFERERIKETSETIIKNLEGISKKQPGGKEINENIIKTAYHQISNSFDEKYGGFGTAPKFPTPHTLTFLLRFWKSNNEKKSLNMVETTLKAIRAGGIFDHLGFGLHRYSTDRKWLVPHFEKMLYDQALMAIAYTEAFQVTRKKEYQQTAEEIFTYVLRDLRSPEGAFYSGEDADVEGEEGKFYLWADDEIKDILTSGEYELAKKIFNIRKNGNFRDESTGETAEKNILHTRKELDKFSEKQKVEDEEIKSLEDFIRKKLFDARNKRIHPNKDKKILTDWNGLMIASLAKAARVFDDADYAKYAADTAEFIISKMYDKNKHLYHRYKDGKVGISGFLNDYAFLTWGLLELYETTFKAGYIKTALQLSRVLLNHFWDSECGGFFISPDYAQDTLIRTKEIYDGAIPTGNSISTMNLIRLSRITGKTELEEKASDIIRCFSESIPHSPSSFAQFLSALDFARGPSHEIVVVGNQEEDGTKKMLKSIRKYFIPNKVVVFRKTTEEEPEIIKLAPFTKNLSSIEGKATVYVCHNNRCERPTVDIDEMLHQLNIKEDNDDSS
jgi:uncharacterized protein YyaL (SSP411 family)